jgi:uncharacterized protein (DUF1778 family)
MMKKIIAGVQFNPKELKFIDEASEIEKRSRANFIYIASLKRAENIFQALDKEVPDLSDEEDVPQEEEVEENISYGKDEEEVEE